MPEDDAADSEQAHDELPWLMARLGRLLERHGPDGVVVMSRAEYERAESATYAAGWQDAAEAYAPRVAAARWEGWLGRWRPLRVLNGPGEVVPFPLAAPPAATPDPAPGPADAVRHGAPADACEVAEALDKAGSDASEPAPDARPGSERRPGSGVVQPLPIPSAEAHRARDAAARSDAAERQPTVRPLLSPKNRRSKAPTVPRLMPRSAIRPRTAGEVPQARGLVSGPPLPGPQEKKPASEDRDGASGTSGSPPEPPSGS